MKEIKSINKISLAKIVGLIYGFVGFFIALIVAISTIANIIMERNFQGSAVLVILFNIGAGLILGVLTAVLTAAVGWAVGYIMAVIYNWIAAKNGGLKIELTEAEESKEIN